VLGELSGPPRVGALAKHATPDQMERFILPVAQAEKAICFAITEPEAGSDAGALQTQAVLDGDSYVLNGTKRFISGSPFCDYAVIICSTSDRPGACARPQPSSSSATAPVPRGSGLQDHGRPVPHRRTSC
jgi:alkylation response protein AidB-like acyl-CoA dehydrogenase